MLLNERKSASHFVFILNREKKAVANKSVD